MCRDTVLPTKKIHGEYPVDQVLVYKISVKYFLKDKYLLDIPALPWELRLFHLYVDMSLWSSSPEINIEKRNKFRNCDIVRYTLNVTF